MLLLDAEEEKLYQSLIVKINEFLYWIFIIEHIQCYVQS